MKTKGLNDMYKTALITGSSRGIGKEIATKLALSGYNVLINYFESEDKAIELKNELQKIIAEKYKNTNYAPSFEIFGADVSKLPEVKTMVEFTKQKFKKIDLLVNNAGIATMKLFQDISPTEWDRIFDVNVKGMYNTCHCIVPDMISEKKGKIINISSVWGIVGSAMETHYSATKGAILAFTKALAKELGPSGITVNAIAPGAVYTDMIANLGDNILSAVKDDTPLGELGNTKQISDMVYFLAESTGDFITGQVISVNGGYVIY